MALIITRKLGTGVRLIFDGKVCNLMFVKKKGSNQIRLAFSGDKGITIDRIDENGEIEYSKIKEEKYE